MIDGSYNSHFTPKKNETNQLFNQRVKEIAKLIKIMSLNDNISDNKDSLSNKLIYNDDTEDNYSTNFNDYG